MTITFRSSLDRDLTPDEVDANFLHVLDSANHSYTASGTGAISQTIEDALRERAVSAMGFIPADLRASVKAGTNTTELSTYLQAWIDAHKGKVLLLPHGVYLCKGLTLDGSAYNGTTIICDGEFKQKARSGSEETFGGAYIGLLIRDCDRVTVYYRGDGNRSNQTAQEHNYLVCVAGATNTKFPIFYAREIRGDGLHIATKTFGADTTKPSNIQIGDFFAHNTADDGRNALSVICVDGLTIGTFTSIKVGGTIASVLMPGGLDIEPDQTWEDCHDINIGTVRIVSAGNTGLAVLGQAVTNDATMDWNARRIKIGNASVEMTGGGRPIFRRAHDLTMDLKVNVTGSRQTAALFDYLNVLKLNYVSRGGDNGSDFGAAGWISDFEIDVDIADYTLAGLLTTGVRRGKFTGRVHAAADAGAYAINTLIQGRTGLAQDSVIYSVDAPYNGTSPARAFRNEPTAAVTFTNCYVADCDWGGYAGFPNQSDSPPICYNVRGRNWSSAAPTNGAWRLGEIVFNNDPSAGEALGWMNVSAGSPGTFAPFGHIVLEGSATYDPASLADGAGATTTVTVTGAALGDFAEASFSLDLQGITLTAWVSAADTVSVRFQNETTGTLDLGSGTLRARVRKKT